MAPSDRLQSLPASVAELWILLKCKPKMLAWLLISSMNCNCNCDELKFAPERVCPSTFKIAPAHAPKMLVHCKLTQGPYATWFWDTVFGVICQLPFLWEEFRQSKLIVHSELRRRAASRRALPCPSSLFIYLYMRYKKRKEWKHYLYFRHRPVSLVC